MLMESPSTHHPSSQERHILHKLIRGFAAVRSFFQISVFRSSQRAKPTFAEGQRPRTKTARTRTNPESAVSGIATLSSCPLWPSQSEKMLWGGYGVRDHEFIAYSGNGSGMSAPDDRRES